MAQGIGATRGNEPLDREWFEAIALDEGQVDELQWSSNADRMLARVMARGGRPG